MKSVFALGMGILGLSILVSGCCNKKSASDDAPPISIPQEKAKGPTQLSPETAKPGQASPTPAPDTPSNHGPAGPYPMLSRQIPSSCSEPAVLLATVPSSAPDPYGYPWSVQTMLVHGEYQPVGSLGELSGTNHGVMFFEGHVGESRGLIARCSDVDTCNKLAAMYKTVVRTSRPQPACGVKATGVTDTPHPFRLNIALPASNDAVGRCARLNACIMATDHDYATDVGIECQKAPHKFKLDCVNKPKCAQVLPCAGY